mmetsp:Transcript_26345/g.49848  ORF Transcript_26345/g.49848 Transcript_26345/m.49848 type:complete len:235 (-) Transcript_26345:836-1540(-)
MYWSGARDFCRSYLTSPDPLCTESRLNGKNSFSDLKVIGMGKKSEEAPSTLNSRAPLELLSSMTELYQMREPETVSCLYWPSTSLTRGGLWTPGMTMETSLRDMPGLASYSRLRFMEAPSSSTQQVKVRGQASGSEYDQRSTPMGRPTGMLFPPLMASCPPCSHCFLSILGCVLTLKGMLLASIAALSTVETTLAPASSLAVRERVPLISQDCTSPSALMETETFSSTKSVTGC